MGLVSTLFSYDLFHSAGFVSLSLEAAHDW